MSFTFYVYANEKSGLPNRVEGNPPLVVRGSNERGRGGSRRDGREKKFGGSCNFCQLRGHKAANGSAKAQYVEKKSRQQQLRLQQKKIQQKEQPEKEQPEKEQPEKEQQQYNM
ncbi:uncharacterized protein LOC126909277 [Daktulosphaira vitifoliae]|uniref:uncharacterized protein LOC126909277 n=1 Tax=Daktulosphaira vitifoliae TaxID=58002 RepID=UPI0021A9BC72|nr:uncharacterized protein LOC126909277 [Daktulosphaira vitifoliae]